MRRALRLWFVCLVVLALPLKGLAAAGWMMGCAAGHGAPVAAGEHHHGEDHAAHHHAAAGSDDSAGAADCSHCAPCSMVAAPAAAALLLPELPAGDSGHALSDGRHASADSDVPLRPPRPDLA